MHPPARNTLILTALLLLNAIAASAQDAGADSASTPAAASPAAPRGAEIIEESFKSSSSATTQVVPPNAAEDFTGIISPQPSVVVQRSTDEWHATQFGPLAVKKVYAPMYKRRINDYSEQLQLGLTRGWLNADQSAHTAHLAGVERHFTDGLELRVYSPAKTIVDCFKYRHKIGSDVAIEALKDYRRRPEFSVEELFKYAKICHVSNVMRPYIEMAV